MALRANATQPSTLITDPVTATATTAAETPALDVVKAEPINAAAARPKENARSFAGGVPPRRLGAQSFLIALLFGRVVLCSVL